VTYVAEEAEVVVFLRDITVRKRQEAQLQQAAFHDVLTDLPNRRMLIESWRRASAAVTRHGNRGAVLLIDLDHFKALNDSMGHDAGDAFLRQTATRLRGCVRDVDTVARLGGDEFAVLLVDLSSVMEEAATQASVVAERIRTCLTEDFAINNTIYRGGCSIGVTLFRGDRDELDGLLKFADSAMYQAKRSGRNAVRFFDTLMQDKVTERDARAVELRAALAGDQFVLHYQIQVDADRKPLGAEALVRWMHPERGLIPPGHFIALAEETGIILELGLWVLRSACQQLSAWQASPTTRNLPISVNVSARQFGQRDFVDRVQRVLNETGAPPHLLKLELTESTALRNVDKTIETMHAIKAFGVTFAMDDFGTGYSSLTYLKRLPFDQLKIDQSFVRGLPDDGVGAAIVESIIAMSRALGIEVIAEGIETMSEFQALEARGCFKYQGFLFSRPIPSAEYVSLLIVH
jgi:diguanylate cyclase (GGDEF)-like protein